ncbi:MAG: hypothetical protein QOD77_41 [Thermoplasmata archaeon]|jgi:hypothetical protein|nr:hypothetical protein [Thermoplasmata archaeon]
MMTGAFQCSPQEEAILAGMDPITRRHFLESYEQNKDALRDLARL